MTSNTSRWMMADFLNYLYKLKKKMCVWRTVEYAEIVVDFCLVYFGLKKTATTVVSVSSAKIKLVCRNWTVVAKGRPTLACIFTERRKQLPDGSAL